MNKQSTFALAHVCRLATLLATAAAAGAATIAVAHAAPTTVSGKDAGATSDFSGSNSNTAQATFTQDADGLPGTTETITFDSGVSGALSVGSHSGTVSLGDGVSVSTTNVEDSVDILNNAHNNSPITGYNVTTGGSKYLEVDPANERDAASVTYTFSPGVQGFGSYFVGIGTSNGSVVMDFNDGTSESYDLSTLIGADNGGLGFFGFIDPNKDITSLTIEETPVGGQSGDVFGMDNIEIVHAATPAATPEPGLVVTGLSMLGMTGLGLVRGRIRGRKSSSSVIANGVTSA